MKEKNKIQSLLDEYGYTRRELIDYLDSQGMKVSRQRIHLYCINAFNPSDGKTMRLIASFFKKKANFVFNKKKND